MAAIFISHSSRDAPQAAEIADALRARGFQHLFLDYDRDQGIPGGSQWERVLYRQLRQCRAVIVLCSPDSMQSDWVFAEITHARAQGKPVIPLEIIPCKPRSILSDTQIIKAESLAEDGLGRLWVALESAGLDPANPEQWQGTRPPYPGLAPFDEADAAVFFGRDEDVRGGLDILNQLRRFGGARLALFLGPSGSGKSSLVRAGILPKLRRSPDWLVVPPMRPGRRPLDGFTSTLSRFCDELDQASTAAEIHARLTDATRPEALGEFIDELLRRAERPHATLVIVIDQLEELLDPDQSLRSAELLDLLLPEIVRPETRLLLVATMRSDFLAELQHHPRLQEVPYRDIPVRPLNIADFARVISGPARVAGVELEDGLVDRILQDTETEQALPLLAYTLRALWEQYGQDGRLTRSEYQDGLGGLAGSIRRAADNLLTDSNPDDETLAALRDAFRRLVRLNEDGQYARRSRHWEELPVASHDMLQRFVYHRLLVSGGEEHTIEVAHEALFRVWPRLRAWLDEDREFLLWRRRLIGRAEEWRRTGTPLRDAPLTEAERWLTERPIDLDEEETALITNSIQLRDADARSERRRRRLTLGALISGLLLVTGLLAITGYQYRLVAQSETATRAQLARIHWLSGVRSRDDQAEPVKAGHHFAKSAELQQEQPDGRSALMATEFIASAVGLERILQPDTALKGVVASPDLQHIVTWSGDDRIAVWSNGASSPSFLPHANISGAAFFADNRLMSWSTNGKVWIWDLTRGTRLHQLPHEGSLRGAAVGGTSNRVLTWDEAKVVRLWDRDSSQPLASYEHQARVNRARLSADGKRVISWSNDRTVRLLTLGEQPQVETWSHPAVVRDAWFDETGDDVLSLTADGGVRLWTPGREEPLLDLASTTGAPLEGAAFIANPPLILTWDFEGRLDLWRRDGAAAGIPFDHGSSIRRIAIHTATGRIATCGLDGRGVLWNTEGQRLRVLRHKGPLRGAVFNAEGDRLLTWSDDGRARLWDAANGQLLGLPMAHRQGVNRARFDDSETRVISWSKGGSARVWQLSAREGTASPVRHTSPVVEIAGGTTPDRLVSLTSAGSLRNWSANDPADTATTVLKPAVEASIQGAHILTDQNRLVTWDQNGLGFWALPDGKLQARLSPGGSTGLVGVAVNPDGHDLLAWGDDGYAQIVDGADGTERARFPHGQPVIHGAVSADGAWALTAGAGFRIHTWRTDRTEPVATLPVPGVHTLGIRNDNRLAFAAGIDGWIHLWEPETGARKRPIHHEPNVAGAAFSPDGSSLVSWSRDGTIRLWNPEDRSERVAAFRHGPDLTSVAFSPDGRLLISWSQRAARVWSVANGYALTPELFHDEAIRGAKLISGQDQAIVWGTEISRAWRLPSHVSQTAEVALRQEVRSGTTLNDSDEVLVLNAEQWLARKKKLADSP